jgi:NADP-dependent 3-hydroxy acid dehydrogenase YdfG
MKTILITGATSGLGYSIAKRFVSCGWMVLGVGRNKARLDEMSLEFGRQFMPLKVDISDSRALKSCLMAAFLIHPSLDVLVNNAGIFKQLNYEACDINDIERIIDTNLKGAMYCTYFCIPYLKYGSGRIINISSVAGIRGIKNQAIYSASKFGLEGFGQAIGQELLPKGISLTTITPGGINTPLWNESSNPYHGGGVENLIDPSEIALLIENIVGLSPGLVLKSVVAFPSNEWH